MIPLASLGPYPAPFDVPSPNHGPRHADAILGVILHATADGGNEAGAISWLCSPASQASCHLLVERDGTVWRLVDDQERAWHAGVAQWRGSRDVNSITIGIEIANRNDGRERYTEAQVTRLIEIGAHYARQGLTPADFVGHADVAPGRKTDPAGFDWARFRSGVAAALAPAEVVIPPATPEVVVPPPAAPEPPVLHTITVPEPPEGRVDYISAVLWSSRAARDVVAQARELASAAGLSEGRVEEMLEPALDAVSAELKALAPRWLVSLVWPLVEREARRALEGDR